MLTFVNSGRVLQESGEYFWEMLLLLVSAVKKGQDIVVSVVTIVRSLVQKVKLNRALAHAQFYCDEGYNF